MSIRIVVAMVVVALLGFASSASAQYFGQNKVQYEQFDFKVLKTDHFDIYYYQEEEAAIQLLARMAERWYTRLSTLLRHELTGRQPLIMYAAHPHFQQTNVLGGGISEGTGGVTESAKRRIIMPFAGGLAETDHVLGHELVHAFQYDLASRRNAEGAPVGPGVGNLPLWFIEGMAEYLSVGGTDANTAMWLRDASSREKMPSVEKLGDPDFFPYRYGHAFWAYVAGRWGDAAVGDMLRATGPQGDIDAALKGVLSLDDKEFTTAWHEDTRRTYAPFFETTQRPEAFGRPILTKKTSGGELNLAPSVSPDGRRVVFLSERSMFSIDMYVADVATGKVTRKLVETAGDPHFESLEFIESAGDWAPDNRRFIFAGVSKGQPVLSIIDVDRGSREGEHVFPDLGMIFNPAWSPDGQRVAFSALKGGVLDLYVFELASKTLTQLTNDPFADHDPEWAPGGRELAWVTDRFTSDLTTLRFGTYRIGVLDVASRQARPLAGFEESRNTNPEFSADGRALYFISSPDGIPNIYRTDLTARTTTRITNVLSGISGITPMTPALSVAAAAQGLVFTVFEDNQYSIYSTEGATQLAGVPVPASDRSAAVLPPLNRRADRLAELLERPTEGLPPPQSEFPQEPYKAKLSLDGVGQPTVGVGADRFGAYGAGGISFMWSDMLGNHEVGTTVQVSNRLEETGGAIAYINRTRRWNWGIVGEVTPYVTGGFSQQIGVVNGRTALIEQEYRITQTNTALSGMVQYPFSRAHRVEFSSGARRIGFTERLTTQVFGLNGEELDRTSEKLPSEQALYLGEASAALVYDTSVFGVTSPILGQRYRFEYSQSAGTLTYGGVLADYRRYFMPVRPLTFAFRGMHYGRYGGGSEDARLTPLYLGYAGMVRGYDVGSFTADECQASGTSSCANFDRLVGSRLAIGNAEIRMPLMGLFNRQAMYGGIPVELAVFADAGVAWTSSTKPSFLGGDRDFVRSVGGAIRFNAFGYAIGEFAYARPLDRAGRGWVWQFNLTPGY